MGFARGPLIVKNGLTSYFDVPNQKSYPSGSTRITDLLQTSTTASLFNVPEYSADNAGHLTFNGTNEYGRFNSNLGINGFGQTISFWVHLTSGTDVFLLGDSVSSSSTYRGIVFNLSAVANTIDISYTDGVGAGSTNRRTYSTTYSDWNKWTHFAFSFITNITTAPLMYINGIPTTLTYNSGTAATVSWSAPTYFINVGSLFTTPTYYKSKFSSLKVYNRQLTQTEISQDFEALKNRYGY